MWPGSSKPLFQRRVRGFTLLEALITTALFSIVIVGVYLLYTTMQNTLARGELKTDLQQNARIAVDRMVQDIRMAGYDPSGSIPLVTPPPQAAVRAASEGCLSFVAYNPSSGASVQITYALDVTILRRKEDSWDASGHAFSDGQRLPQVETVSLLKFTYYDAYNGVITPLPITSTQRCPPEAGALAQSIVQLDYFQMKQVRRVGITLQTRGSRPGVFPELFTLTSDVLLRNR
jgi:prepilin-type N-terminal cleavage/methylation domain-containing protein